MLHRGPFVVANAIRAGRFGGQGQSGRNRASITPGAVSASPGWSAKSFKVPRGPAMRLGGRARRERIPRSLVSRRSQPAGISAAAPSSARRPVGGKAASPREPVARSSATRTDRPICTRRKSAVSRAHGRSARTV